ncbi:putative hydroxymethylpyrimidine transporter CytX [Peptoniphilaceae bacterium SGI.137]|nr:putative hydroxymethylpyrimidine transporter CytX [Peptoniphilaceae bacterium]MDY5841815.1 putative hydroxymethylpyrimidine transporter CytX [Peptoniphilaceae bacterium]MDY6146791.1 putative hydroxymethylpyrimidine transporter CytX [Peptoniphilaceae bacterium]
MTQKKTTVFGNALIWFGAAVSIAEILTGTFFAEMGFWRGLFAILLGHVIGCALLFLAGLIGGKTGKSAMETTKMSFGGKGALLFVILNILQLVGWTAIMIYDGALAANEMFSLGSWRNSSIPLGIGFWSLVIGALILVWLLIGISNLGKLNTVAMAALLILTGILCYVIFRDGSAPVFTEGGMSFGAAVEISVAMPLSWLPLISDYTCRAEKPVRATAASAITYGIVSCWMYIIGMGAGLLTGESGLAQIMLKAGLGAAGLLIVILSTVTTTFLDAYSAGISSESISKKIKGKWVAVAVTVIGTACAIFFPITKFTDFLYFIGSVFAPMIAIQIADFFLLKKQYDTSAFCIRNLLIWCAGFGIYRYLMKIDTPLGSTLPDMLLTMLICVIVERVLFRMTGKKTEM